MAKRGEPFLKKVLGDDFWKKMVDRGYRSHFIENAQRLTPREVRVLTMRFKEGRTIEEVGQEFAVTRERIRQIESKGLRTLRGDPPPKPEVRPGPGDFIHRFAREQAVKKF